MTAPVPVPFQLIFNYEPYIWQELHKALVADPTLSSSRDLIRVTLQNNPTWNVSEFDLYYYVMTYMIPQISGADICAETMFGLIELLNVKLSPDEVQQLTLRFDMRIITDNGNLVSYRPFSAPKSKKTRVKYTTEFETKLWKCLIAERRKFRRIGKTFRASERNFGKLIIDKGWKDFTAIGLEAHFRRSMKESLWRSTEFDKRSILSIAKDFSLPITDSRKTQLETELNIAISTRVKGRKTIVYDFKINSVTQGVQSTVANAGGAQQASQMNPVRSTGTISGGAQNARGTNTVNSLAAGGNAVTTSSTLVPTAANGGVSQPSVASTPSVPTVVLRRSTRNVKK